MTKRKPTMLPVVFNGDWVQPRLKGYLFECCRCGLVHTMNFRIVSSGSGMTRVQFQPRTITRRQAAKLYAKYKREGLTK